MEQRAGVPGFQGMGVFVRNTFIDVDSAPPEPVCLRRSHTAPPRGARPSAEDGGTGEAPVADIDDGTGEDAKPEAVLELLEHAEDEDEEDEEAPSALESVKPPEGTEASRMTTMDWMERPDEWAWVANQGQMVPADAGAVGAGPPLATSMTGQAVTMPGGQTIYMQGPGLPMASMVPMGGMSMPSMGGMSMPPMGVMSMPPMGGYMPMAFPIGTPADYQGVGFRDPARGMRWPEQSHIGGMPEPGQVSVTQGGVMMPMGSDGGAAGLVGASASVPQPHTLSRDMSVNSGCHRVNWTVDARKLKGNDKQAVSPPFELNFGLHYPSVIFKMMIYPRVVSENKGGASFKKAKGHGFVQLKCEAELSEAIAQVTWRISIGSGEQRQDPRGPVHHNFALSAVSRLPKEREEWDFLQAVDQESMTFVVCLEISPM